MRPPDTTRHIERREIEIPMRTDVGERARMTFGPSDDLLAIVQAGVGHLHPDRSQERVIGRVLRPAIGDRLFEEYSAEAR